jgi:microcin C transport system substrate-binding protein
MKILTAALICAGLAVSASSATGQNKGVTVSHGLTLLDTLKYPPDFRHLDYVNPTAPKGGTLRRQSGSWCRAGI